MDNKLHIAKEILNKYNQEHVLRFYSDLTEEQKNSLLNQILNINFDELYTLFEQSKKNVFISSEEIEPLSYLDKENLFLFQENNFKKIGYDLISTGKVGVITLAGGQGTRLGFKGPKGTFYLETTPPKSLFEILCTYLKKAANMFNVNIPWYIMTSTTNHFDTINFFQMNNFFGYHRDNIVFFTQDNLPIVDINGKLVLSEVYKINLASNGNGNLFKSLKKSNLIKDMEQRNLEWLFISGVDNVLLNPLDPIFIGYTASTKYEIGSKTIFKENPKDLSWVFARRNGVPSIVDCENFVEELSKITNDNGDYLYRETNMLAHLFNINALKKMANIELPYHRAFRKNAFVNEEGMKQVPDGPNVYKFELFVFDAFSYFNNIALLRVNKNLEFAPIKDFNGPYNPEVAAEKYESLVNK